MVVDVYTKGVLTVIAACLLWLTLGGGRLVPATAQAQSQANRVVIAGWVDAGGNELRFAANTALPVVVVNK